MPTKCSLSLSSSLTDFDNSIIIMDHGWDAMYVCGCMHAYMRHDVTFDLSGKSKISLPRIQQSPRASLRPPKDLLSLFLSLSLSLVFTKQAKPQPLEKYSESLSEIKNKKVELNFTVDIFLLIKGQPSVKHKVFC